ncbi:alpha-L-fucosidase [Pedobacter sp. ISL-68]|uniref:alpha-L-fucosidase n=1 Tax=unclassified Pedobacter TaxID=2628915 RepID=UPI001BE65BE9|nr:MULTISPECIES: alpha-L-fucosidase [unclassified Pedobacter]MBT2564785.1 alpha-L-fucosidase [Pedobacter sp. ISL-64]MBT2593652.1 alpha-L-fucosidase [Pedobacter sp. ISL-68]
MRYLKFFFLLLPLFVVNKLSAQQTSSNQKMQWFADAKLGIFIHWGIYSVNGISESWSFFNNYINHDAYMKQLDGFTAAKYKPEEWVNLIKESGAKYAVITTKHHDGIALWDSKAPLATTTLKNSAAKKDLITPFVAELKKSGLKTGLYFSLPDWSYPDYDGFTRDRKRYDYKQDTPRFKKFQNYFQGQLNELSAKYNPDLVWFDGDWEHSGEEWQAKNILSNLRKVNQNIIINSRLNGHGDYDTPEQGVPIVKPNSPEWELCYTMNDSWGYQPYDNHYKSSNMIIRTLVDCISMGGNLLLDIGPKADGTIASEQVKILKDLGRWTKKYSEAIYGTQAGLPDGHFVGKTTLSKNKAVLYLYLDYKTKNGILLNGIKSKIKKVELIGNKTPINTVKLNETDYFIDVNESDFDNDVTVLKVFLNEPIQLSKEKQQSISLETLFAASQHLDLTNYNLRKLSYDLNSGVNIFQNTNLTADGFEFKSGIKNVNPKVNNWIIKNAEALYKTTGGIPAGHYQGNTALSADKKTLYLFVEGTPTGPIDIKGLKNNISRIRIVGEGTMLPHEIYNKLYWSKIPGIVYIPVPKDKLDPELTVIAVLLDSPIDLYREKVGAIESNL